MGRMAPEQDQEADRIINLQQRKIIPPIIDNSLSPDLM